MSILFALALTVAPAPYDDGAQGCLAYGIFTEVVDNGGSLTFEVPAPPDGFEVTAVVLGDESDPVQHTIVAPASPGQVVTSDVYIDHVHICYVRTEIPEELIWPSTTQAPPTQPSTSTTSDAPTTTAIAIESTSTSSPTPSSSPTTPPSSTSSTVSSVDADPCQEDEPCWDCATMGNRQCGPILPVTGVGSGLVAVWASCLIALGVALVGVTRRRT